jgi:hypothetical protein
MFRNYKGVTTLSSFLLARMGILVSGVHQGPWRVKRMEVK